MRAVIQRVTKASVEIDGRIVGQIGSPPEACTPPARPCPPRLASGEAGQMAGGLLVYLSVGKEDGDKDAEFIAGKLTEMRIFADEAGKMNRGIREIGGEILLVSNFTLHGDCRKGRRPDFDAAAEPAAAQRLYEKTAQLIAEAGVKVARGVFGAYMQVESINDGPVTFLLDSTRLF